MPIALAYTLILQWSRLFRCMHGKSEWTFPILLFFPYSFKEKGSIIMGCFIAEKGNVMKSGHFLLYFIVQSAFRQSRMRWMKKVWWKLNWNWGKATLFDDWLLFVKKFGDFQLNRRELIHLEMFQVLLKVGLSQQFG